MIFKVYSVYDCKVEEFSEPFIQREQAVERSIKIMLQKSPVPKDDLTLYEIGSWDSENGILKAYEHPVFVETDLLGELPYESLVSKGVVK